MVSKAYAVAAQSYKRGVTLYASRFTFERRSLDIKTAITSDEITKLWKATLVIRYRTRTVDRPSILHNLIPVAKFTLLLKDVPELRVLAISQIILVGMLEAFKCARLVALLVDHNAPVTIHQREKACDHRSHEGDNKARLVSWGILRLENKRSNKVTQAVSDVDT